jgi:hypothetical protein
MGEVPELTPPGAVVTDEHDRRSRNAIPFSAGPTTSIAALHTITINSSKRNETKIPQLKY